MILLAMEAIKVATVLDDGKSFADQLRNSRTDS